MNRRPFIQALGIATLASATGAIGSAFAQNAYPNRPIRLIVPLAAGGGSDGVARIFAPQLSERLGQPVIVENRPGASGIAGTDYVANAAPDGYTILTAFSTHSL